CDLDPFRGTPWSGTECAKESPSARRRRVRYSAAAGVAGDDAPGPRGPVDHGRADGTRAVTSRSAAIALFFPSLKTDLTHRVWVTRADALREIGSYIDDFDNTRRL